MSARVDPSAADFECSIPGCGRRGAHRPERCWKLGELMPGPLCQPHYARLVIHGDVFAHVPIGASIGVALEPGEPPRADGTCGCAEPLPEPVVLFGVIRCVDVFECGRCRLQVVVSPTLSTCIT